MCVFKIIEVNRLRLLDQSLHQLQMNDERFHLDLIKGSLTHANNSSKFKSCKIIRISTGKMISKHVIKPLCKLNFVPLYGQYLSVQKIEYLFNSQIKTKMYY